MAKDLICTSIVKGNIYGFNKCLHFFFSGDQLQKKRKLSCDEDKVFGTDLVIYDKQNRCLLTDGEYDFFLEEIQPGTKIAHTLSTWEDIDHEVLFQAIHYY